jgi:hypothetical protein
LESPRDCLDLGKHFHSILLPGDPASVELDCRSKQRGISATNPIPAALLEQNHRRIRCY